MSPQQSREPDHYLDEQGRLVFTRAYHLKRGYCCGNGCRHCPYHHKNVPPMKNKDAAPKEKKTDQPFFEAVYEVVRRIPRGRVTSYGAVAEATGTRLSARMVGWALNMSASAKPRVPAHRVVNRLGILSGKHHFATPTLMQELLEQEGVKVVDDTVVDFERRFWKPLEK